MVYHTNGNSVEKKVLDIILDHARVVLNGTEVLAKIVDCWKTPGREKFNKYIKELDSLESKGNSLKNSAMKEVTDAGPALLFRQELMQIIRSVDQIIDLGQGAAFFLEQLDGEWIPPENFVKHMLELIEKTRIVSKSLTDLLRALFQSLDKVIVISESIEIMENKADANYRALIIELAKMEAKIGVNSLIREAVDRIEDMIDSARDVASYIRIYAMSR
ncbi:MAG: DUF47 family protein [Candidatus Heimdallarchaeota archaeon]|nr:DUF47 family protein [Candidatus Heimdallarchaeota archaeon]MBY8994979.1 DUF47 family protein [Candidatus Heimdallarchaeota archaeon]